MDVETDKYLTDVTDLNYIILDYVNEIVMSEKRQRLNEEYNNTYKHDWIINEYGSIHTIYDRRIKEETNDEEHFLYSGNGCCYSFNKNTNTIFTFTLFNRYIFD